MCLEKLHIYYHYHEKYFPSPKKSKYHLKELYWNLDKWSPALQIRTVLLSIQALLSAPNPDDPLANDVAELWKFNETEALRYFKNIRKSLKTFNWKMNFKNV